MVEIEPTHIGEKTDETSRQLLIELREVAHTDMLVIDTSLDIYASHPEAVGDVVAFLSDNPEQFPVLKAVVDVMDTGADSDLRFSDKALDDLKKDPEFERLHQEKLSASDAEAKKSAVARLRGFWLKKGLIGLSAVHDPAA